jgi:two-component system, OmpR family, heavy metal sensor histidine kinase CusS
MKGLSIRWRLTLWYGLVLATVLAVFGTAVYLTMQHELLARTDEALGGELDEIADDVQAATDGTKLARQLERRFARHEAYEFQVSRVGGELFFQSDRLRPRRFAVPPVPSALKHLDFESVTLGTENLSLDALGHLRLMGRLVPGPDGPLVVQAATSLTSIDQELTELLTVLLLSGPLALIGALGGGYVLARKALAPVDRIVQTADQITATRLDQRIDVRDSDDELGRLARTLNGMIARLERSFEEVRRFTADAAHELRTPIAVLRNEAEVALRLPRQPEQYRSVLEDQLEELERLSRLAERLLFLCREDAGLVPMSRELVRLDEVVEDATEHMHVVAEEKGVGLAADPSVPCPVRGDEDQLRRLLFNLLDNAIKFTPAGGTVTVECVRVDAQVRIVVTDTGIGIPCEHLPHVFQRFYRVDPARGREVEGSGLGLAIARSIAEAHGGAIGIESTVGVGTRAILTLPADPSCAGEANPGEIPASRETHRPRTDRPWREALDLFRGHPRAGGA